MTMLLSTFHQSGKARQEKFWPCYPTQPFSVKQYTLWLLLYLFLHFYFSLSHLSINWAMRLLAALLVSSCTALKLWFLLFFNKASPRPYAHVFITIISIFVFRRWHLQLHLQNRLKWLCAQTFRALLTSAVHFSLFWDHMQGNISFALCKLFHSQVQPRSTLSCRQVMRLKTNID